MTKEVIEARITAKRAAIVEMEGEITELQLKLHDLEWELMSWNDVQAWLLGHSGQSSLRVKRVPMGASTHATLNNKNELIIGGYYHHDFYPRGCDMYVTKDFKQRGA